MRLSAKEECVSLRDRKSLQMRKGDRKNSKASLSVCLSLEKAALPSATKASCPESCFTFRRCGHGRKQSPLVLQAHGGFLLLPGDKEVNAACNYECLCVRQICHRVQCESQPAPIRALNHDSVTADRLKDKLLRCNTQYSSQNSLLSY